MALCGKSIKLKALIQTLPKLLVCRLLKYGQANGQGPQDDRKIWLADIQSCPNSVLPIPAIRSREGSE